MHLSAALERLFLWRWKVHNRAEGLVSGSETMGSGGKGGKAEKRELILHWCGRTSISGEERLFSGHICILYTSSVS